MQFRRVLKVIHPDHDIIGFLANVLADYRYHICKVECSFDFVNLNRAESIEFLNFCRRAIYVTYRGKALPIRYPTTAYFNNVWTHRSAGIKGYIRPEGFYRQEVTLKTPYLRSIGVQNILDLYKLEPSKVAERITFRCINFDKWRKGFHHQPRNNKFNDHEIEKEIESILQKRCLNDAAILAKKYAGERKFVDVHLFQPIFRAASQDNFIKDEHPECIRVSELTGDKAETNNVAVRDIVAVSASKEGSAAMFLADECTTDGATVLDENISKEFDNFHPQRKNTPHIVAAQLPPQSASKIGYSGIWKNDYG
jgi:hypothetical protein